MKKITNLNESYLTKLSLLILTFIGIPIYLYFSGEFERRTTFKEIISIVTILGFTLLLSQFFTSRLNKNLVKRIKMINVLKIHKFIGYLFISILLIHPFLIVIPKLFDDGVTASDAFVRLITSFGNTGVILGLIAYASMLILIVTAFFRFKLHIKYRTWRNLHGYLTLLFVITAIWHVINLGRHSNISFSTYYLLIVAIGSYYLLKTHLFKTSKK